LSQIHTPDASATGEAGRMLLRMDRLRRSRSAPGRRFRLDDFRAGDAASTQLVIGLVLVVAALVGLVYTLSF
jgi:hypothetical protein